MGLRELLDSTVRAPDETKRYGPGAENLIDLWWPPGVPTATVVVLHGGFWRAAYDRTHTRPMCVALAEAGYLVAAVEYRRVGNPGGGWPGTFTDVAAALDALPRLTRGAVTGNQTVLLGHSAGGHLALWAAGRHRVADNSARPVEGWLVPAGVVALAAVCDLRMAGALGLGDGAVQALLGDPRRSPDRYRMADPARLLPLGRRCVLVHGTDDDRVPLGVSRRYRDLAVAAGDDVMLVDLPGADHFDLIDPAARTWPAVTAAIATALGDEEEDPYAV
ncbi:alpha/beta hydrolase family protein [Actinokineospora sp. 24-640]